MARGDHPQRTPFYGVCLITIAFLACWPAASLHTAWMSGTIYALAALTAWIGFLMTFRDYSPSSLPAPPKPGKSDRRMK
ncbi:MAG TPA: hypothetical protein VFW21_02720 [Mycobacterium sp.]|jgi:hypothetical protein|nr:hypothetical protein [Mycobacterium sp.]